MKQEIKDEPQATGTYIVGIHMTFNITLDLFNLLQWNNIMLVHSVLFKIWISLVSMHI